MCDTFLPESSLKQIVFSKRGHITVLPIPHALLTMWHAILHPKLEMMVPFFGCTSEMPGPTGYGRNNAVWLLRLDHKIWYGFFLFLSWDVYLWDLATMLWGSLGNIATCSCSRLHLLLNSQLRANINYLTWVNKSSYDSRAQLFKSSGWGPGLFFPIRVGGNFLVQSQNWNRVHSVSEKQFRAKRLKINYVSF